MCDDGEPPAKRCKYNLRSYSKPRNDQQKSVTISTTNLLDLNDDCFHEIFDYFNVIELVPVSQVCKRLNQLAESYFTRKYTKMDFSTLFKGRLISNEDTKNILLNFGPMIQSMSISRQMFHNHETVGFVEEVVLKDIAESCGKTLQTLELNDFNFTPYAVESLNMLSKSLKSLSLEGCVLAEGCIFHLSNFSSLKELKLIDARHCYGLMDSFPALENLELNNVSIPSKCILEHFVVTHRQLKTLEITFCDGVSSEVLRSIGKYMESLQILCFIGNLIEGSESIVQIQNNILHLSELKNLHTFGLSYGFLSIGNLLAKMVSNKMSINQLVVGNIVVDDVTIEAIAKMKNLVGLNLIRITGLNNKHLIEIAKEVTQLKELRISPQPKINITSDVLKEILRHSQNLVYLTLRLEKFRLDHILYNDILDIGKERRNGMKLKIKIFSTDVQFLVPQQTIDMNKNSLIIEHRSPEQI